MNYLNTYRKEESRETIDREGGESKTVSHGYAAINVG